MYQKPLENSPGVDFNAPVIKRRQSLRFLKDRLTRWGVAIGGLGVIVAIVLIFFYLLYEVAPLFKGAELNKATTYTSQKSQPAKPALYLSMDEQAEIALRVYPSGLLNFSSTTEGESISHFQLPLPEGSKITRIRKDPAENALLVAGLSNGQVIVFKPEYRVTWPDDKRVITPKLSYPFGADPITLFPEGETVDDLAVSDSDEKLLIAGNSGSRVVMKAFTKEENFLTEEVTLKEQRVTLPLTQGPIGRLLISPDQFWLYIANKDDRLSLVNISDIEAPWFHSETDLTEGSASITEIELLLGGVSLLAGDEEGNISQWFIVRNEGKGELKRIRHFKLADSAITKIIPEHRRKGFLATDNEGRVGIYYTTAYRSLLVKKLSDAPINQLAIAPRGNYLILDDTDSTDFYRLKNEHPEISWSALWDKIWYESYNEPDYVWQSSASNNDFEPKLSLTPLAFGTLKAAFYAMLLATPLAICGAIYTAYFMAPGLRRKIKPTIELMEALPTVILGFLAGLWLAPLIENHLAGIFALLLFIPLGILLFAYIWDNLPGSIRHRVPDGWHVMLLIPVVLLFGCLAMWLDGPLETLLFNGDMRIWLTSEVGIPYDQRNALIVGLAMGFAVIPTILLYCGRCHLQRT